MFYEDKRLDRKEWLEQRRKREAEEKVSSDIRVGEWILRFIENGYTREEIVFDERGNLRTIMPPNFANAIAT